MVDVSPEYLRPVLRCAHYTGMRKAEILGLTWDRVDLKAGFIRLKGTDTKTKEARNIPIGRERREILQGLPIGLDVQGQRLAHVFTRRGHPITSIREVFSRVCPEAGLTDVVCHDLRHTTTTNLRWAGVDTLTAMKITRHKTMALFRRYNTLDEDDLTVAQRQMDPYMDTRQVQRHEKSL
jgi:integrase